jgi:hypothetical protein
MRHFQWILWRKLWLQPYWFKINHISLKAINGLHM